MTTYRITNLGQQNVTVRVGADSLTIPAGHSESVTLGPGAKIIAPSTGVHVVREGVTGRAAKKKAVKGSTR